MTTVTTTESAATSVHTLLVRFCETDLMGIVHHANYLIYCEAARVHWLHRRGISYESWTQHGVHLAVVETSLRFKKAARFDETLCVAASMTQLSRVTVRFEYRITRGEELLCSAHTLQACVGDDMRLKRIPAGVADVFRMAEL